nr:FCD domain-containing protein [Kribbella italica]
MALEEILTAREAMEVGLMPAVARRPDSEELAECTRLAGKMAELEAAGQETIEVDRAFHLTLYKGLQNPLVDNLIELFWEIFVRLGDAIPAPTEAGRAAVHLRIVEALQSGEPLEAVQRMQDHFNDVRVRAAMLRDASE